MEMFLKNFPAIKHSALFIMVAFVAVFCKNTDDFAEKVNQVSNTYHDQPSARINHYSQLIIKTKNLEADAAIDVVDEMYQFGYFAEARYALDIILKKHHPGHPDALALLVKVYLQEMQPELAKTTLKTLKKEAPDHANLSLLEQNIKKLELTLTKIDSLDKAIKNNPKDLDAYLHRSQAFLDIRRKDDAIYDTRKAISIDSLNAKSYYFRSIVDLNFQHYDSALVYALKARGLSQKPDYDNYISLLRQIMHSEKQIQNNPSEIQGYTNKARALAFLKFYDEAENTIEQGIKNNPHETNLHLFKALVMLQSGNPEKAENYIKSVESTGVRLNEQLKNKLFAQQENYN